MTKRSTHILDENFVICALRDRYLVHSYLLRDLFM